jgi:copper chaperone CopZ
MSLKKELSKIDGLVINSVAIGSANVTFDETKIGNNIVQHAVEEAGYSLVSIQ